MNEAVEFSHDTAKLVARRLKLAARHVAPRYGLRDRLTALIEQVQRQGLGPRDFAGMRGEDALIAIAQAIPPPLRVDTETQGLRPNSLVIDSLTRAYSVDKTAQFAQLYGAKPRRRSPKPEQTVPPQWQRVLNHALGVPR